MAVKLFSEYQPNVDALARRIAALTSLSSRQAQPVAISLLGRKELKIKSSSLAQIFKQIDAEVNTKQVRNEFLASGLIERIEGTGKEGKPAIYTINADVVAPPEGEVAEDEAVEGAVTVDDAAKHAPIVKQLAADVVAVGKDAEEPVEPNAGIAESAAEKAPKKRGQSITARDEVSATDAFEPADTGASDAAAEMRSSHTEDVPSKRPVEFVSKVGRGARVHRRKTDGTDAPKAELGTKAETTFDAHGVKDAPKTKTAKTAEAGGASQAKGNSAKPSGEKKSAARKQDSEHNAHAAQKAAGKKKQATGGPDADKSKHERKGGTASQKKTQEARSGEQAKKKKTHGKNAHGKTKGKAAPTPESEVTPTGASKGAFAAAKAAGLKIARVIPRPRALAKVDRIRTDIVKVDAGKPAAQGSRGSNGGPARKLNDDVATIMAWLDAAAEREVPYASRRQRAYEVFNDEKAFEGKRGERLFRRLNEKGVNMMALRITPSRSVHFTGFYNIGSNRPFIMVENLDTYDEIVRLLRGRKNAKLFGVRVGGVIFGGGCKAAVSHALDDYLDEIGYDYKFVYYAGDIDREGAKIVEQARAANVTEVRLHAGMYKAMLAAHRARVKEGRQTEPASSNQGVPQNLAEVIRDLPVVTRVQFKNVLRAGGRIPQEILTSSDYRDSDSGAFDRALNG